MNSPSDQNNSTTQCEFQNNLQFLRQISFFSGLPLEMIKVFAYLCTREIFKPGQNIFSQGDEDGCCYCIISGNAELIHEENGVEHVLKSYQKDSFVGILSILGAMPRLFSLRAKETTVCMVITREKFTKAVERFPETMPKLIQTVLNRIFLWEKQGLHTRKGQWENSPDQIGISVI